MRSLDVRELRSRLLREGVARKHVKRTVRELRHHVADLERKALAVGLPPQQAVEQAKERIGDQERIIQEILARSELKSWAHRFPWGVYGLLPALIFALTAILSIVAVVSLLDLVATVSGLPPAAFANALASRWWALGLLDSWRWFMMYGLPFALAVSLCFFAARREAPVLWPTVGVVLILLLGFSFDVFFSPPDGLDQTGTLGAGIALEVDHFLSVRVLRLFVPLILVLVPYYWWCQIHRKESHRLA